jgi:L-ascorbate metabolism protein UlaG (beta-lactamase superfamily)
MHWGTFKLTDEDMDEPPRKLRQALKESGLDEKEFITVDPGQIIHLNTVFKKTSNVISNE